MEMLKRVLGVLHRVRPSEAGLVHRDNLKRTDTHRSGDETGATVSACVEQRALEEEGRKRERG